MDRRLWGERGRRTEMEWRRKKNENKNEDERATVDKRQEAGMDFEGEKEKRWEDEEESEGGNKKMGGGKVGQAKGRREEEENTMTHRYNPAC